MPPQNEQLVGESADRIARLLLEENREVLQAAKVALKHRLMRAAMQMAMNELGDPEAMAEQVYSQLGSDHPKVAAAGKLLQDRLLRDVAERSLAAFHDPSEVAERAFGRIEAADERLMSTESAMKDLLLKQVLTDALGELDEEMGLVDEGDSTDSPEMTAPPQEEEVPPPTARAKDDPVSLDAELLRVDSESSGDGPADQRRTWVNKVSYADATISQAREAEAPREREYFYTYGVTKDEIPDHVLQGGIQADHQPYLVRCGPLYAVVSRLSGLPIHSDERDAFMNDPAHKRAFKQNHIATLQAISAAGFTIVPRPYATLASSEDKIQRTVSAQSESFDAALQRLSGRREWSVQLFKTQGVSAEAGRPATGLYASGDSYGRIYDAGLEEGPRGDEETEESGLVAVIKRSIYNALLAVAADATMNATYGAQTEKGLMVLNAAYLVDADQEETFLETANRLNERQKSLGFALVCSGRRVPLSFWQ